VVRRELNSYWWPTAMFFGLTSLAYGASFATFRVASALIGE
jgi:ferrous iron transport protein B